MCIIRRVISRHARLKDRWLQIRTGNESLIRGEGSGYSPGFNLGCVWWYFWLFFIFSCEIALIFPCEQREGGDQRSKSTLSKQGSEGGMHQVEQSTSLSRKTERGTAQSKEQLLGRPGVDWDFANYPFQLFNFAKQKRLLFAMGMSSKGGCKPAESVRTSEAAAPPHRQLCSP